MADNLYRESIGESQPLAQLARAENPVSSSTAFERMTLLVEGSVHPEKYEKHHVGADSKMAYSVMQEQTSQRRGATIKTAVQMWLIIAIVGTILGAASDMLHHFSWLSYSRQQSGTTVASATQQLASSPQATSSSLFTQPSPTTLPSPTATPTPLPTLTPSVIPTPIQLPLLLIENPVVADAGFEMPSLGHGGYQYNPSGSSWTFNNGSGIAANGSAFTNTNPDAPEGVQVAFLQQTGSFRQSISFGAGSYHISFRAAQRKGINTSVENFRVLIDGRAIGTFAPSSFKYKVHSTNSFTVSAGSHVLTFQGLDSHGGDNTAFIDVVTLQ